VGVPNHTRYQLRYASIFSIFRYFRKWSNMWSTHLFRTFFRKVYRPNCQCCQGVQRFEQIYQGKPLWVSRTLRATSCATPRFFQFFIYFRKWSNMWSSHLFRTFCRKVYRLNCQRCQGVQRFEQIYKGKTLWVSRTIRATSCATLQFAVFSRDFCHKPVYYSK